MSPFQPGDVIGGRYRLARIVGEGATGVVWSARNEATERDFALKLMLPQAAKDPRRLQRFFKEAKLAGRLRHRSIVEVYDLGRIEHGPHAGSPYLVMELLDGEPLDALLRRVGRLPVGAALRIARDVARGLQVAHEHGVVHRDLKPANVFLHRTLEGATVPKILDFGISKLVTPVTRGRDALDPHDAKVGTILGSPAYMSPEQSAGEDLDPRADLWSLGVVLYKALSGALPFVAAELDQLMLAINTRDPQPLEERVPGLPREVYAIVRRCLSRRRGARPSSAAALADAIDAVLEAHDLTGFDEAPPIGGARSRAESRPALAGDGTGAHAIGLSREAVPAIESGESTGESTSRSRALALAVASLAAAAAVALFVRARGVERPSARPAPAAAAPLASAASAAPIASAPAASSSAAPATSASSVAKPSKPAPKAAVGEVRP